MIVRTAQGHRGLRYEMHKKPISRDGFGHVKRRREQGYVRRRALPFPKVAGLCTVAMQNVGAVGQDVYGTHKERWRKLISATVTPPGGNSCLEGKINVELFLKEEEEEESANRAERLIIGYLVGQTYNTKAKLQTPL